MPDDAKKFKSFINSLSQSYKSKIAALYGDFVNKYIQSSDIDPVQLKLIVNKVADYDV